MCLFHFGIVWNEEGIEPFSTASCNTIKICAERRNTLSEVEKCLFERHRDMIGKLFEEITSEWTIYRRCYSKFINRAIIIWTEKMKLYLHLQTKFQSQWWDWYPTTSNKTDLKSKLTVVRPYSEQAFVLTAKCITRWSPELKLVFTKGRHLREQLMEVSLCQYLLFALISVYIHL